MIFINGCFPNKWNSKIKYIGIKTQRTLHELLLSQDGFGGNQVSLNDAGIELAKKLKLIYELTQ